MNELVNGFARGCTDQPMLGNGFSIKNETFSVTIELLSFTMLALSPDDNKRPSN